MMSATLESEEEVSSLGPEGTDKSISVSSIGSIRTETSSPIIPPVEPLNRKLGSNEVFAFNCHNYGNLNIICGLTLLTKHSIDEGLMKCSLQEFQHMFPQLTSCVKNQSSNNNLNNNMPNSSNDSNLNNYTYVINEQHHDLQFSPMECPILPLDLTFKCKDMLHDEFCVEQGPLWRVQLIDESTMDIANLRFGPELSALLEDTEVEASTRWRYFLRYHQGSVNQANLSNYDENEEGHRSFILMAFHPSVTDIHGCFHLMKHFISILDTKLGSFESESQEFQSYQSIPQPHEEQQTHLPIETLLPSSTELFNFKEIFPKAKSVISDYMMPHKSPMERFQRDPSKLPDRPGQIARETCVLRGWLNTGETDALLALLEEDDCNLQAVLLAAGLIALARTIEFQLEQDCTSMKTSSQASASLASYPPLNELAHANIRATNAINLRNYCTTYVPRHGNLTTRYETDHEMPLNIDDRADFWRYAHELTVKNNYVKGKQGPSQMLKQYNHRATTCLGQPNKIRNEMDVSYYGDLDRIFGKNRVKASQQNLPSIEANGKNEDNTANLGFPKVNLTLEDVFFCQAAPSMGTPFIHSAHIFNGKLSYILSYNTSYIKDQRMAFMIRDEIINILRMAVE